MIRVEPCVGSKKESLCGGCRQGELAVQPVKQIRRQVEVASSLYRVAGSSDHSIIKGGNIGRNEL